MDPTHTPAGLPSRDAPPAPLSVLMTADAAGGVFSYVLELARALRPAQVRIGLALMGPAPTGDQRAALRELSHVQLFERPYKLEWMDEPWEDVQRAGEWLLELERELAPDCVHLNGYVHAALPFRAPVLIVAHSCVLSWWRAVHHEPAPACWDRYRREVARGIARAALLLAPTRAMLDALREDYGPPAQVAVIPNAIDGAAWWPASKQPLVLAAGRIWDAAKNLGALAEVARELPWEVAIAGQGATGTSVAGPPGATRWLGCLPRSELRAWLGRAAIYASPARYEPFGLSVLEAAHSGCALVLGDIPSLRENWSGAARFVPPDDGAALRAAIAQLIAQPELRQKLGKAARRRAAAFNPAQMADSYFAAYRELGAASGPGPRRHQPCAS